MKDPLELCKMANKIKEKTELVPFWVCCGIGTNLKYTLFEIRLFKEEDIKKLEINTLMNTDELKQKLDAILKMKPVKSYTAEVFLGDHQEQVKEKIEKGFLEILDAYLK